MQHAVTVNAPIDEVVAWHARPGAIQRLLPPWLPLEVVSESTSLVDGVAQLRLLGFLPWSATHLPEKFQPDRLFVDRLTTPIIAPLLEWNHYHQFDSIGQTATRITDRVQARVPRAVLAPNLYYRGRQVVGDFAAHAMMRRFHSEPLTVGVTGADTLIGRGLCAMLSTGGHRVVRLMHERNGREGCRVWNPVQPDSRLLNNIDAVVHLMHPFEAMPKRSNAHDHMQYTDHVESTRRLAELVGKRTFIVASTTKFSSTTQFCGDPTPESVLLGPFEYGDDQAREYVSAWEQAAEPARRSGARVVHVRTGAVLAHRGQRSATWRRFATPDRANIAHADEPMPWLGIDDVLDVYLRCIVDEQLAGSVNAVSPRAVSWGDYVRIFKRVLGIPTPASLYSLRDVVAATMCSERTERSSASYVYPHLLQQVGHEFRYPDIESTIRHSYGRMPADALPRTHLER